MQREGVVGASKAKYTGESPIAKKYREGTLKRPRQGVKSESTGESRGLGPVLKHGPRRPPRRRGEGASAGAVGDADESPRWDPKDSELCLCWPKPGEILAEGLSRSDVQLDGRTWA